MMANWQPFLTDFLLSIARSEGGFSSAGHLDPLRIGRGLGIVVVVPVPPLVWRRLRVTLWRILPSFLTAKRGNIEVAPDGPHGLVSAIVNEICAEHLLAVAEEHVVPVPFIDSKVFVEAVENGVPRHLPAHPLLQARDIHLRGA